MPGLFDGTPRQRPVTCAVCEQPLSACRCPRDATGAVLPPSGQTASIGVEKRGKGKIVTVIAGLDPVASDLDAMLVKLKSQCGTGGGVDAGVITLQGDLRDRAAAHLRRAGYKVQGV
jgi:translation initiation factor 1